MEIKRTYTFIQCLKYVILLVLVFECVKGHGRGFEKICKKLEPKDEDCENNCKNQKCKDEDCENKCKNQKPKDDDSENKRKKQKPEDEDCENKRKNQKPKDDDSENKRKKQKPEDDDSENKRKNQKPEGGECEKICKTLKSKGTLLPNECLALIQNLTTNCRLPGKNFKKKLQRKCLKATANCETSGKDSITQIHPKYKAYCRKITNSNFKRMTLVANSSWVGEKTSHAENVDVEVMLPEELFWKSIEQQNDFSSISFTLFSDTTLFEDENNSTILNDEVIEVAVGNTSIHNLTEYVNLTINHKLNMLNNTFQRCVFWSEDEDEDDNSTGHWDTTGCKTVVQDSCTLCQCDHLSYFAVLLDFRSTNNTLDEKVVISLTYITQIGCGISAIFLAITIFIYCVFRNVKSDDVTKIHMNLCGAIFLLNVNFLTSLRLSMVNSDGLCKTIAVFLHYSLLCTFTWMGIEAFQLYLLLIKVFNTYIRHYMQKLAFIGWGLPVIVVLVCVVVNKDNYGKLVFEDQDGNNTTSMCWITDDVVHYVTNCGYYSIIFFGNAIMLIIVCVKLFYLQRQHIKEQRSVWKDVWTIFGLCCLLGITWGLAFFTFGPLHLVELYLFTILNSLQGFFVFLWYCAMKRPSKDETSSYTTST